MQAASYLVYASNFLQRPEEVVAQAFGESYASCGRVSNVIPVDVAVPGCPPTPFAIMQGILTAIAREK